MADFGVDAIVSSIRQLTKEKNEKDNIIADLVDHRKQLEKNLENVTSRHVAVSAKWSKSMETTRITEQKLLEFESQVARYEAETQRKRKMIQELNDGVEKESALMQDQLRQFEKDITELTEKFRSAANVYSPVNIDDELLKCSTKKDELLAEIESNKLQLKELTEKMSFYKEQLNDTEGDIIDENTSIIISNMCEKEYKFSEMTRAKKLQINEELSQEKEKLLGSLNKVKLQLHRED